MLPNFLICGASKSGSEWLQRCLAEHPEVFISFKAANFFDLFHDKGQKWYESCFSEWSGEKAVGEKSTTYIISPKVPERIHKCIPSVKLLFVLREPVERAYSHYKMQLRASDVSGRIEQVLMPGQALVEEGRYFLQISRFLEYFNPSQIKVLLYDDLQYDKKLFLNEIFSFLQISTDFEPSLTSKKFHVTKSRPRWPYLFNSLVKLTQKLSQSSRIGSSFIEFIRRKGWVNLFHTINRGPSFPQMTMNHKKMLSQYYHDDTLALSEWLGRDLSGWLDKYNK